MEHGGLSLLTTPTTGFVLKLFAALGAAGFGLLGIGTTTRDEAGKLNRNGWIAFAGIIIAGLFAVGSSIYDFVSAQDSDRAAKARSEQLLAYTRKAVFPMRGIEARVRITLNGEAKVLSDYRASIRKSVAQDRACLRSMPTFTCVGSDVDGSARIYAIPTKSNLFAQPTSEMRRILDNISISLTFAHETALDLLSPAKTRTPKLFNNVDLAWNDTGLPASSRLTYDYVTDVLALELDSVPIKDSEVRKTGAISLADVLPGYIRAIPSIIEPQVCPDGTGYPMCEETQLDAVMAGLKLEELLLTFPFPKALDLSAGPATTCVAEKGAGISTGIAAELPIDVEELDALGVLGKRLELPVSTQSACDLTNRRKYGNHA